MSCQGNMLIGPVGTSLGGLTPQAAQIQEVIAMLRSMSEGQLRQCRKSWKFTAVFAKSEKWLTPAPTSVGTWKTEEEVLGWAGYLD